MKHIYLKTAFAFLIGTTGATWAETEATAELKALKQELATLLKRVEQLEKKPVRKAPTEQIKKFQDSLKQDVKDSFSGTLPKSFKVPGFDTSVVLEGAIRMDMIADRKVAMLAPAYDYVLTPYIPLSGNRLHDRKGETHLTARMSSLGVTTSTPVGDSEAIVTHLDGDFLGYTDVGTEQITNHYYFRLRQGYIKWGDWLFGQTDTTFQDPTVRGETVDVWGPGSLASFRQGMVRYTWRPRSGVSWAFAAENPETDYLQKNGTTITRTSTLNGLVTTQGYGLDRLPDLITQLRLEWGRGHMSLRGVVRELRQKDGITPEKRATGSGIGFSGHVKPFGDDKFMWSLTYGRGIGRYIPDLFSQSAVYSYSLNNMRAITGIGGMVGYQRFWTYNLRSTLMYSVSRAFIPGDLCIAGQEVNQWMRTGHLNLIWSPVDRLDMGVEASYGSRKVQDGRQGVMHRCQAMVKYSF